MSYKIKLLSIFISGLLMTYLTYMISYSAKRNNFMESENLKLEILAETISTKSLGSNIRYLTALAERQEVKETLLKPFPKKPDRTISDLLTTVQRVTDCSLIYLMNNDGITIASNWYGHQSQSLYGNNYSFRPYFIEAFKQDAVVYPALGVTTNKRGIYFSKAVYLEGRGSKMLGVLVIKDDLSHIDKLLREEMSPSFLTVSPGIVFAARDRKYLYKAIVEIPEKKLKKLKNSKQFAKQSLPRFEVDGNKDETIYENSEYFIIKKEFMLPQEISHPGLTQNKWVLYRLITPPFSAISLSILIWPFLTLLTTLISLALIITKNKASTMSQSLSQAHETIREQALETDQLFNSSTVGTRLIKNDFTVIRINDTLCTMIGEKRDELMDQKCYEQFPCDLCHTDNCPLTRLLNNKPYKETDSIAVTHDNQKLNVCIAAKTFNSSENQLIGIIEEYKNIDERKKAEFETKRLKERAETANKVKSEFLANISHEIRTPLHAIIGMSELLQESKPTQEQMEYLDYLTIAHQNLQNVINDILDFSKIESKSIFIEEIDFDLELLVNNVLAAFQPKAEDKGLHLNCDFKINNAFYRGAPTRIKQILHHLLDNAIKFTTEGSINATISIRDTGPVKDFIAIQISDTGIGMNKEQLSIAFDQFVQGTSTMTKRHGGTGLGLSICDELIKLMHGELTLSSTLEIGTTAYLNFPLTKATMKPKTPQPLHVSSTDFKCLIIVGKHSRLTSERDTLNEHGFTCIDVENIEKGVELLDKDYFDIFIVESTSVLDKKQEKLNDMGILLTQKKELVKVILSPIPYIGEGTIFRNAGFDAYLARPYKDSDLEESIRYALSFKQSLDHAFITTHYLREQKLLNKDLTRKEYYEKSINKSDFLNLSVFIPLIEVVETDKSTFADTLFDSLLESIDMLVNNSNLSQSCLNLKNSDTIQSLKATAISLGANRVTTWCIYAAEVDGECDHKLEVLKKIRDDYATNKQKLLQTVLINEGI